MIAPQTKFRFLKQTGGGLVYKQNSDGSYHVQTDEGFFIDVPSSEIVEVISDLKVVDNIKPKERKTSNKPLKINNARSTTCPVFDLHINSNKQFEHVLEIQLALAKQKLADCKTKNIKMCILIHGDGEGILRDSVRFLLRNSKIVQKYEPANALTYGTGATKVFLI